MSSNGWKEYTLDELTVSFDSRRIPLNTRQRENRNGPYPYYGASGVIDTIDDYLFDGEFVLISEDGENLRSRTTPIAFKVDGKFWVNNHAHVLQGNEPFLNDWIVYFFQNIDLNPFITGAVQPKLNQENLYLIKIPMPESEEAKKSVAFLSSLDDKIELNRQTNATLEAIAQAIFKEWFVDFNFPGATGELVESELGMIPEAWRVGKLGDIFKITMGQSPPGESYNEDGIGTPFFQGRTDFTFRFPEKRVYTSDPKRLANQFDTLVSVRAPVGDMNIAAEDCCIGRGLAAVIEKNGNSSFTYYFMKQLTEKFRSFEDNGTVFGSINKSEFEGMKCVIPNYETITSIESICKLIDYEILNNEQQSITLAAIRDSLLPKLMRGEIYVTIRKENSDE
ncbi:MAG: restriction endonuclease subunit S [Bellilinea sp.]